MKYNRINIMQSLNFLQYLRDWASDGKHDLSNEIKTSEELYHKLLNVIDSKETDKTETIYQLIRSADKALDKKIQEALLAEEAKPAS